MNLPDFLIRAAPDDIRLTGHRIGLEQIVHLYRAVNEPRLIHDHYPTLPLALVHKVIAFYLENQAEVDGYVAECQTEIERQRATASKGPSLSELQARMQAGREAERP